MRTNDPLRLPLTITAAYVLLAGIAMLFPSISQAVFGRATIDPAVEGLYGVALLNIGAVYALLTSQKHRSNSLVWVQLGGLVLAAAVMLVYWIAGDFTARTILAPLLINLLLAAWIASRLVTAQVPGTQATGA